MHSIQDWLVKTGTPTWVYDIATPLQANLKLNFQQIWPTDIAWVYGISFDSDGVDQDNNPLPTTTQMTNLYLFLKDSSNDLLQYLRLSNYLLVYNGVPVVRPYSYIPISVPGKIDTSNSYYYNPTGIAVTTPATNVHLKAWYMKEHEYKQFKEEMKHIPHR